MRAVFEADSGIGALLNYYADQAALAEVLLIALFAQFSVIVWGSAAAVFAEEVAASFSGRAVGVILAGADLVLGIAEGGTLPARGTAIGLAAVFETESAGRPLLDRYAEEAALAWILAVAGLSDPSISVPSAR